MLRHQDFSVAATLVNSGAKNTIHLTATSTKVTLWTCKIKAKKNGLVSMSGDIQLAVRRFFKTQAVSQLIVTKFFRIQRPAISVATICGIAAGTCI
jgi:hypothetical protein